MFYFWVKLSPEGNLLERRKHGVRGLTDADQFADGFVKVPLPNGVGYDDVADYNVTDGLVLVPWLRNWQDLRNALGQTNEYQAVDAAAEESTRLSHTQGMFNSSLLNLIKDGATVTEFGELLIRWKKLEAAIADEPIDGYSAQDITDKVREIATEFKVDLDLQLPPPQKPSQGPPPLPITA